MAKTKTKYTNQNINDFLNSFVNNEQKKVDSYQLIDLLRKWTGFEPKKKKNQK